MKASTKTATVSTSSKVSAKAGTKETAVETIMVPAEVKTSVSALASADSAYQVASTAREKTIVVLGDKVRKLMAVKAVYDVVRASIKPLMEAAFQASNKASKTPKDDKTLALYIGQQLARVMSIAYPGGKDATPAARKAATQQLEKGMANGLSQPKLLDLAAGRAKYGKDAEGHEVIIPIKKDETRGGHNKVAPIDAFKKAVHDAMTLAKTADVDREQMLTIIAEGFIALEMMDSETEQLVITEQD